MADPELLLVRHGRSAHVDAGEWIDVHGVRAWMAAYDAAEILPDHAPPDELQSLVRDASVVIASDLPRTVASAARLAPGREIVRTPLLREAPMETPDRPLPAFGGIRLPLRAWGMLWGTRWIASWLWNAAPPGIGPAELARAEEAADFLVAHARETGGRVVAVTHATFRVVLARALARRGWRGPDDRPYHEWSAWRYLPSPLEIAPEPSTETR
jgi:broad specificity phosphatase PhoE